MTGMSSDSGESSDEKQGFHGHGKRLFSRSDIQKWKGHHAAFYNNALLALSVGFWTATFSLPAYAGWAHYAMFGARSIVGESEFDPCGDATVGIIDKAGERVWCGLLPNNFKGYWSNAAQMVIFTVYRNTGTTINLAWQGAIGTFCACLNFGLMTLLYPDGAFDPLCAERHERGEHCVPKDTNYNAAIVWLDTLAVLFLFLFSRSNENTIKFGMSWHVYFMMNFMNPEKGVTHGAGQFYLLGMELDDENSLVRYTSYLGAAIAVLATFVPRPLRNMKTLSSDVSSVIASTCDIWTRAINHLSCNGDEDSSTLSERLSTEKQIDLVADKFASLLGELDGAWWETCNIGKCGRTWGLLDSHVRNYADIQDLLFAVQSAIKHPASTSEVAFYRHIAGAMRDVQKTTAWLLTLNVTAISDGVVDSEEKEELESTTESLEDKIRALWDAFNAAAAQTSHEVVTAPVFVFALTNWSRGVIALTNEILDTLDVDSKKGRYCCQCLANAWQGLLATWSPKRIFEGCFTKPEFPWIHLGDHLKFTLRNFIPITICYVWGVFGFGTKATRFYNSTMASTLSLLITPYAGGAFQKNTLRLLGVSLGKTLPILLMLLLNVFHDWEGMRHLSQWLIIWMFTSLNCYVYYTSLQWSLVGCLVAGFGIIPLMASKADASDEKLAKLYVEIGLVVLAIFIQLASDALLRRTAPREKAVRQMRSLGKELLASVKAFGACDLKDFSDAMSRAHDMLLALQGTTPQTDPRLLIAPGPSSHFKIDLLRSALPSLNLVVSDLTLLRMAIVDEKMDDEKSEARRADLTKIHRMLASKQGMSSLRAHFESMLESTFDIMVSVLGNTSEVPVQDLSTVQQVPDVMHKLHEACREMYNDQLVATQAEYLCRSYVAARALVNGLEKLHNLQIMFVRENA
eukprot:TRINITY_DN35814_c0_g2_i1.p1 TRINITY_DN35814_c0_g2~~TRINITY_DN35814_c0_g2_i1.p1  ORF type:complete len:913 (-),score=146.18 TRINITY_DN35814_c0_g2_i1:165-2903(-)